MRSNAAPGDAGAGADATPVIGKPVSAAPDAVGAAPLDEGPLLWEVRTSIIRSLMSAYDPWRKPVSPSCVNPFGTNQLRYDDLPRSRFYVGPTRLLQFHHAHHA
jgi:hypothetical protein